MRTLFEIAGGKVKIEVRAVDEGDRSFQYIFVEGRHVRSATFVNEVWLPSRLEQMDGVKPTLRGMVVVRYMGVAKGQDEHIVLIEGDCQRFLQAYDQIYTEAQE